jgi:hypothetical protein
MSTFDDMNKPALIELAEAWHMDTKDKTSKELREELLEMSKYDCPGCIYFVHDVNLQSLGFPVIMSKNGNACRQLKTILPIMVKGCPEFLDGTEGKSRDARHRQSKRSTNGDFPLL